MSLAAELPEGSGDLLSVKLVIVGNSSVGKTSILSTYIEHKFIYNTFLHSVDVLQKVITYDRKKVKLYIYDTAGQERYRSMTNFQYKNSGGIVLVFDLTDRRSFDQLPDWLGNIRTYAPKNAEILLVGNKKDLDSKREVTYEESETFAEAEGLKYFEVSAKTGEGLDRAFMELVGMIGVTRDPKIDDLDLIQKSVKLSTISSTQQQQPRQIVVGTSYSRKCC